MKWKEKSSLGLNDDWDCFILEFWMIHLLVEPIRHTLRTGGKKSNNRFTSFCLVEFITVRFFCMCF
jgi:hypothetical protein